MKTIRFTIFSIIFGLLVLVIACKKETNPAAAPQTGSKISVTGQDAAAGLKSTLSGLTVNWVANTDMIGLYCSQAASNGTNAAYTAITTGAASSFTGAMTWGTYTHDFYAYYPWVAGSNASTAVPITLSATQEQTGNNYDHIGALDFTVARASASPGTSGQPVDVNLNFKHVFTLLEFDLQLASGQNSTDLSSIELYSTDAKLSLNYGRINLTQTAPTGDNPYTIDAVGGTKKVALNVSGCTLTSGSVTQAYMMILAGNQVGSTSSDMTIKITSVAGVTVVVKTGINFVRGKRYTIDLSGLTFSPTVTDVETNVYNTVTIGSQVWTASNLKTSKYSNGDLVGTTITDATLDIASEFNPKYQWAYLAIEGNAATYGRLYTWFVVTDSRNICPTGWHVPSDADWTSLSNYLGGDLTTAGGKLKETGTSHWADPFVNTGATNEAGFTALGGGCRIPEGVFTNIYDGGYWWSSTQYNSTNALIRDISYVFSQFRRDNYNKNSGYSVRCLRD
ncbi:MAG: FISUMP domain-containing protein [Mariniphaga sp.]